jgi:hypothetical protein
MLAMALMAFTVGFIIHLIKAGVVADGGDAADITRLANYATAAMFIGFASAFSGVSLSPESSGCSGQVEAECKSAPRTLP